MQKFVQLIAFENSNEVSVLFTKRSEFWLLSAVEWGKFWQIKCHKKHQDVQQFLDGKLLVKISNLRNLDF